MKKSEDIPEMSNPKEAIAIDPNNLTDEWLRQAENYHYYCIKSVDALIIRNKREQQLEALSAQIDKEIRDDAVEKKPTESQIKNMIFLDGRYQKRLQELNEAEYEYRLYSAMVKSLEQKSKSLEYIGYFQGKAYNPEPAELTDMKIRDKINKKFKKGDQ